MSTYDLAGFVAEIHECRDKAHAATIAAHDAGDFRTSAETGSEWFAYALTLSKLHRFTRGAFGSPIDAQPSPYDEITTRSAVTR